MQKQSASQRQYPDGFARVMNKVSVLDTGPDGALISGNPADEGRITVVYDHGDAPPQITIAETSGHAQTVLADGVAVAVVARADGPKISARDVLLVERFVAGIR